MGGIMVFLTSWRGVENIEEKKRTERKETLKIEEKEKRGKSNNNNNRHL